MKKFRDYFEQLLLYARAMAKWLPVSVIVDCCAGCQRLFVRNVNS